MNTQRTARKKTIIEKRAIEGTDTFVYGATDGYGDAVTFVATENHPLGAQVALPKKPDEPMKVDELWKRSGSTLQIAAGSAAVAAVGPVAHAMGPEAVTKALLKDFGMPETAAAFTPIENTIKGTIETAQQPFWRNFAVFAGLFTLFFGLQKIWAPERAGGAAALAAAGLAGIGTLLLFLLE